MEIVQSVFEDHSCRQWCTIVLLSSSSLFWTVVIGHFLWGRLSTRVDRSDDWFFFNPHNNLAQFCKYTLYRLPETAWLGAGPARIYCLPLTRWCVMRNHSLPTIGLAQHTEPTCAHGKPEHCHPSLTPSSPQTYRSQDQMSNTPLSTTNVSLGSSV